ncbi:MAG: hypothetical protein ACI4WS_01130 [Oscillospiraceae bacterium]
MIRYKCPECGASCHTAHCYDCDRDIPMSQRYDDEVGSEPSADYSPAMPNSSAREKPVYSRYSGYKCPTCGATCKTSHCFDCDKDLPLSARIGDNYAASSNRPVSFSSSRSHTASCDVKIGVYFRVDNYGKRFEIYGDRNSYKFSDLVNFELYESDELVAKGGVGRAIVGGALFGDVGAIVGATTRKSESKVNSLYIRLTLKSVGMKKIVLISSPTPRNSFIYKTERKSADEIISQLELIAAQNKAENEQAQSQPEPPQPVASLNMVADELL